MYNRKLQICDNSDNTTRDHKCISQTGADPYCKITCEGKTVVTPVRKDTLDPQLNATAVFYVKTPAEATVKIQVYCCILFKIFI